MSYGDQERERDTAVTACLPPTQFLNTVTSSPAYELKEGAQLRRHVGKPFKIGYADETFFTSKVVFVVGENTHIVN